MQSEQGRHGARHGEGRPAVCSGCHGELGSDPHGNLVEHLADKIIVQWPEMVDVYKGRAEYYGTLV